MLTAHIGAVITNTDETLWLKSNGTKWGGLPFKAFHWVQESLRTSACAHKEGACDGRTPESECEYCSHGAHMLPKLAKRYQSRRVAEIGVCTGLTSITMLDRVGDQLHRYLLIDPWGGKSCNPGCNCYYPLRRITMHWPAIKLKRRYSNEAARVIPDGSLDLIFVDAAHDYRNVYRDVLNYWPKLQVGGVMAGHDMSHKRNFAELSKDELETAIPHTFRSRHKKEIQNSMSTYGVGRAVLNLFLRCEVRVHHNVWWVEREHCKGGPIYQNQTVDIMERLTTARVLPPDFN